MRAGRSGARLRWINVTFSASDQFVEQNLATGTASLLTVPLIGWTPKSRGYDCAFSVSKYGEQQQVAPSNSDCGNGVGTDGTPITDNDPLDASSAIDESFVQAWIEQQHGLRILDYLDLHYYPQNGVALGEVGDAERQALRLRSTPSLWDGSYTDESWINEPVELIPRMRQWVNKNYPGTKLALSEYNWGALEDINGALAQADVLGIFGREGLDMATLFSAPSQQRT